MSNSAVQSMRSIDRFLQEVAATEKRAAEANSEPGSIGGATTHPVKDVDDRTEDAQEGSRSAENTADVKADEGPASVDNTPENVADKKAAAKRAYARKQAVDGKSEDGAINPPGTAEDDQLQIGTRKSTTGQDPAVETSSAKAEKEDSTGGRLGNTTHPARTNNGELDGYKYAEMPLDQLAKVASDMGNNLLAQLANLQSKTAELVGGQKKLDMNSNGKLDGSDFAAMRNEEEDDEEKEAADLAGQAGWELAGLLSGNFDKKAADSLVHSTLEEIIKTASDDADKVAAFLASYEDELAKKAEGEMPAGVDPSAMGMGGAGPDVMPGSDPAAMGGDPAAAGGGAGGDEISQIVALLEQLGISPEELEAAMAAEGGQGEAGGAPAGGEPMGEPAPDKANEAPGMEVEASAKRHVAKQATAKKGAANNLVRDYIQEILERSRH
jgi:hypothetical protein